MSDAEEQTVNLSMTKSTEQLNKQILDYYFKFGQNRDLEKYLRLNRKNNKSSSEGSLSGKSCKFSNDIFPEKKLASKKHSKSVDFFDNSSPCEFIAEEFRKEDIFIQACGDSAKKLDKEIPAIDINSVNNCQTPDFVHRKQLEIEYLTKKFQSSLSYHCDEPHKEFCSTAKESQVLDDSIVSIKTPKKEDFDCFNPKNKMNETPAPKILEWDSLGDVGYQRTISNPNLNRSMSTIERSVLKGFFADRGIEISFPNKSIKNERGKSSEPWRETLENVKKKYSSSPNIIKPSSEVLKTNMSKIDLFKNLKYENDQSKNIKTNSKLQKSEKNSETETGIDQKHSLKENYCQTSIVGTEDQFIQCNFSSFSNTTTENPSASSESSFIYITQKLDKADNISNCTNSSKESNTVKTYINKKIKLYECDSELINNPNKTDTENTSKELQLGISLLCSLIESKKLNDRQKKRLAKKIVNKITTQNFSSSENGEANSIHFSLSGVETLSNCSDKIIINNVENRVKNEEQSEKTSNIVKTILGRNSFKEIAVSSKQITNSDLNSDVKVNLSVDSKILKSTSNQKSNEKFNDPQLFETMNEWLEPLTNSELAYDKKKIMESKENINSSINIRILKTLENNSNKDLTNDKHNQKQIHINWIENEIKRLENLKNLINGNNENRSSSETKSTFSNEITNPSQKILGRMYDNPLEFDILNQKVLEENMRGVKKYAYDKTDSFPKKKTQEIRPSLQNISKKKIEPPMTRLKLETPSNKNAYHDSSESIKTFVKNKKREFIENYKIAHSSKQSYDHPMVSDHYSEAGYKNIPVANKEFFYSSKNRNTSTSTSHDFISSESMSLPVNSAISSTSTTHLYDVTPRNEIGIQTSDSVLQTTPIFGKSSKNEINKKESKSINHEKKTVRVYGPKGKSQQIQVKPTTISYTIRVDDNRYMEIRNNENLSLQDHLRRQCPQFYAKASKRQAILKEMQRLRKDREELIRDIVENTSIRSISRKLSHIPPPPTKCLRVFSTKEMKALTKKKQKNLPEVVNKLEKQRKEKQRKGTKILADVFNKRLQKQVHKGKLSLEHSRTVI